MLDLWARGMAGKIVELRAALLISGAVRLVHPCIVRKSLIRASGHAIEKEGKSAKNSVFGAESISPLQLQNDAQNLSFLVKNEQNTNSEN